MEISTMAKYIKDFIRKEYRKYLEEESIDLIRIISICELYKTRTRNEQECVNVDDIYFSSPEIKERNAKDNSGGMLESLQTTEFKSRYRFFIKVIYSCIKIGVSLFDIDDDILTMKNNYQLIRSLETRKKELVSTHINILTPQYKKPRNALSTEYRNFLSNFCSNVRVIDLLIARIDQILASGVVENSDNMLSLILPYFYTHTDFIEVYGEVK